MSAAIRLACLGLTATAGCVIFNLAPYPAAAVMAGTGVAAVGVNRSMTGACWGACTGPGRICDHDSGMCVLKPCGGECRYDEVCHDEKCVPRRREQPSAALDVDASTPPSEGDQPPRD